MLECALAPSIWEADVGGSLEPHLGNTVTLTIRKKLHEDTVYCYDQGFLLSMNSVPHLSLWPLACPSCLSWLEEGKVVQVIQSLPASGSSPVNCGLQFGT